MLNLCIFIFFSFIYFPFLFFSSFLPALLFVSFILLFIQYYVCGVLSGPNVWDTHTLTLPLAVSLSWEELEENTWKCHHHFCPEAAGAGLTNANSGLKYLLPPSSRLALKWMPLSSLCTDSAVCLQLPELLWILYACIYSSHLGLLEQNYSWGQHSSNGTTPQSVQTFPLDLRPDMAVSRGTFFRFLSCVAVNIRMHQSTR